MPNKFLPILFLIVAGLGCGLADRVQEAVSGSNSNATANVNANKTLTDKAVDTAVGEEKIGIAECDDAVDLLEAQANDPNDNFVTKAVKKTALNTFRDQLRKNLEENKTNKKEVAKFCKEFSDNLRDSIDEGNSNTSR